MPTRKIVDEGPCVDHRVCRHPEHDPPRMIVLSPGTYEHECPGCGHVTTFTVRRALTVRRVRWLTERSSLSSARP